MLTVADRSRWFVGLVGVAALLDRVDRVDLVFAWTDPDRLRVPVSLVGIGLPTPTLPPAAAGGLVALGLLASVVMTSGLVAPSRLLRPAAGIVVAVSVFDLVVDQQAYSNHTVLIAVLGALDVAFADRDDETLAMTVRAQTSIVYVFAALSKIRPEWLSGRTLERSAQSPVGVRMVRDLPLRTLAVIAVFTVVVELVLAAALWSGSWRQLSVVMGVGFHVAIIVVLGFDLGLAAFGVAMVSHLGLPRSASTTLSKNRTRVPHPTPDAR